MWSRDSTKAHHCELRAPKLKTPIQRKSTSHTEWLETSQRQPQRVEYHGGMPAKFWRKSFSTYNSVNQIISSKLSFLRNLLEDVRQQMEDTGSRKVKTRRGREVKGFPGWQQRAAPTKLLRTENKHEWLQEVWFQGERWKHLIILRILEKSIKRV